MLVICPNRQGGGEVAPPPQLGGVDFGTIQGKLKGGAEALGGVRARRSGRGGGCAGRTGGGGWRQRGGLVVAGGVGREAAAQELPQPDLLARVRLLCAGSFFLCLKGAAEPSKVLNRS